MTTNLRVEPQVSVLRAVASAKNKVFEAIIARKYPGFGGLDWFRACAAVRNGIGRPNDDTGRDVELEADAEIAAAYDDYVKAMRAFYAARDGEGGVLGGRGL